MLRCKIVSMNIMMQSDLHLFDGQVIVKGKFEGCDIWRVVVLCDCFGGNTLCRGSSRKTLLQAVAVVSLR